MPDPDPRVVQAIHNELSIHLFGEPDAREEMAEQIARRLLRDVPPLHTLQLQVTKLDGSTLNARNATVTAKGVHPAEGKAPPYPVSNGPRLEWCVDTVAAQAHYPYGARLRIDIHPDTSEEG